MNTSQNDAGSQQALLEQLIAALSRLARTAEGQIAYLEVLGQSSRLTSWLSSSTTWLKPP